MDAAGVLIKLFFECILPLLHPIVLSLLHLVGLMIALLVVVVTVTLETEWHTVALAEHQFPHGLFGFGCLAFDLVVDAPRNPHHSLLEAPSA